MSFIPVNFNFPDALVGIPLPRDNYKNMENLLLPSKVEFRDGATPNTGEMVVMPCFHGYGTTLGNVLRRVLLSSLPGAAVEYFKVKGIQHEFSAIEGVEEDVVEMILNLKQLVVKMHTEEPVVLNLVKKGPGPVTAADIEKNSNIEIINKDMVIANMTSNRVLEMEIGVGRGRGFKTVEQKDHKNYDLGTIVVDSIYTPVKDVGYSVEFTRVGDVTNYEKLTLNIETDGAITPREAVWQATKILMDHFTIVLDNSRLAVEEDKVKRAEADALRETEAAEIKPQKKNKKKADKEAATIEKKAKKAGKKK